MVSFFVWRQELALALGWRQNLLDAAGMALLLAFLVWLLNFLSRYIQ